jgi:hypothetical protein
MKGKAFDFASDAFVNFARNAGRNSFKRRDGGSQRQLNAKHVTCENAVNRRHGFALVLRSRFDFCCGWGLRPPGGHAACASAGAGLRAASALVGASACLGRVDSQASISDSLKYRWPQMMFGCGNPSSGFRIQRPNVAGAIP